MLLFIVYFSRLHMKITMVTKFASWGSIRTERGENNRKVWVNTGIHTWRYEKALREIYLNLLERAVSRRIRFHYTESLGVEMEMANYQNIYREHLETLVSKLEERVSKLLNIKFLSCWKESSIWRLMIFNCV